MKKRVLKRTAALLLMGTMLCGLAGCSKNEGGSSQSISNSSGASSEIKALMGSFDWDKALSEFYIDGIKMEYPFSEGSLGENFIFDDTPSYGAVADTLIVTVDHKGCKGLWLFKAEYRGITPETYSPDCVPDALYSMYNPSFQGVMEKTSMNDVYDLWGKPDKIEDELDESGYNTAVYYGDESGKRLYLRYDIATNEVESIKIDFTNMKG